MSTSIIVNKLFDDMDPPKDGDHYVYCLIDETDKVIYVGQTCNLRNRIYQHLSMGKEFVKFTFEICSKENSNDLEARTIIEKKPEYNKVLPINSMVVIASTVKVRIHKQITSLLNEIDCAFEVDKDKSKRRYITIPVQESIEDIFDNAVIKCRKLHGGNQ